MENYYLLKKKLFKIIQDINNLFLMANDLKESLKPAFYYWKNTLNSVNKEISEDIIRVAVVGAIKSGKSTFINSFLEGDYLKRGAGVVTSIVTRLRGGEKLKATLFLKSIEEINSDINRAVILLPSLNKLEDIDIRNSKNRITIDNVLNSLLGDELISDNTRNINSVLLSSYIKGYEKVKDLLKHETIIYEDDEFKKHHDFTGDDNLAVFLRDIALEVKSDFRDIEIADCQGSDSVNPLHLAMIEDYLMVTHLIIYVISSRTGLRRADIRFLNIIKKMGIIDNIIFIINIDFSEHDSMDSLNTLIEKIKGDLSIVKQNPQIFSLSGLYNLFQANTNKISLKDTERFKQWDNDKNFTDFSNKETKLFKKSFTEKINKERYTLLLQNHIERLNLILSNILHWIRINQDIFTRDKESAYKLIDKINYHQNKMNQLKDMIKTTLDGVVLKIKKEAGYEIDRFFDAKYGELLKDLTNFIREYNVSYDKYQKIDNSNFLNILFMVFNEFREAIDHYIAESINPRVMHFIINYERKIKEELSAISEPYDKMIYEAVSEYSIAILENLSLSLNEDQRNSIDLLDIESIKGTLSLKLPPIHTIMRYSTTIKTEAMLKLGFYKVKKFFRERIFKKKDSKNIRSEIGALKHGIMKMKRETDKSIIYHFKDYKENIKFQYMFKIIDALVNNLYEILMERFQIYFSDISKINELINNNQNDKDKIVDILKEMEKASNKIHEELFSIKLQGL
ncbi:MAG: dynamin family protein [Desulfobacterales bacterium]|nr:dynamin family protein [Desulfobacterales bacterium]MBF0395343.1 dynamin family protein [Desulfobacterales bacterium]